MKECPYGVITCKCVNCACNAASEGCNHGYCITCFECEDKQEAVHNVYLCTGFEEVADNAQGG